jgi:hypothetical protein
MPAGRPTEFKGAYCNEVIAHLSDGFTLASFGGIIGACRSTLYNWADEHPEFMDAIKKGRAKGQLLWETRLTDQAINNKGNTTAIIFAMKNLYQDDWAEKIINEHTGKDGTAIQVESASDRTLAKAMAMILARGMNGSD